MKTRQFLILTSIVAGVTAGSATAQTSGQSSPSTDTPAANSSMTNTTTTGTYSPMNPGTAAESANTTALTTSSYHQDHGLFSSWFGDKK